jgi:AcrR family transcriptional regulator
MHEDLRARRGAQTHDALIEASLRLFLERGYETVTMEEIAEAAGVSRRTAFRYFPSKESLVFPRQDERLARFERLLADRSGLAQVRQALLALSAHYQDAAEEILAQHRVVQSRPELLARDFQFDQRWEAAIVRALPELPPRRARFEAAAMIGLARAVLREWCEGGAREDLVELARDALNTLGDPR